jgi:hypothetical protein
MIRSHLIATKALTTIFKSPAGEAATTCNIQRGSWLGVIDRIGDWIHVISTTCEGWVRKEDVAELNPMDLHIQYSPGKPIEYVVKEKLTA